MKPPGMNLYVKIIGIFITFLFVFCYKEQNQQVIPSQFTIPVTEKRIITQNNEIGFDFFRQLNQSFTSGENLLISPSGISFSLHSLLQSSSLEAESKLKDYLKLSDLSDSAINQGFNHLQQLFSETGESATYNNSLVYAFSHQMELDSKFLGIIRSDNKLKTSFEPNSGFIDEEIIPSNNRIEKFQLINQVGFNSWSMYQKRIEESPFYYNPDNSDFVQMIVSESDFKFYSDANIKAVELPLGKGNINMMIILPNNMELMWEIANGLNMRILKRIQEKAKLQHMEVYMPKIELSSMQSYAPNLKNRNLDFLMNPQSANFQLIRDEKKVCLSDFEQLIDINIQFRSGIESLTSDESGKISSSFFIDHPFIIAIYEKFSNAILFVAKVQHP